VIVGDPPFQGQARPGLRDEQREHNRKLTRSRILVDTFFARWKTVFGIAHQVHRGNDGLVHPARPAPSSREEDLTAGSDHELPGHAAEFDARSGTGDSIDRSHFSWEIGKRGGENEGSEKGRNVWR
jgi:hypothetical protein